MKCKLFPYKQKEIVSIQELKQTLGWQISCFDLPDQWKYTQGEGVKIAVLDTGVQLDHPDLIDNLLPGKNILCEKKDPVDVCGHGTSVISIIIAQNNSFGVCGISPKAKVLPIKVLSDLGAGDLSDIAKGIRWAVDYGGVDFISMSLGCSKPCQQLRKAIQYAENNGVICFCSAGNYATDLLYPSRYHEVISIAACDQNFLRYKFNCVGEGLDFICPGCDIVTCCPQSSYNLFSGTSAATPWLVGVCSLLLSYVRKNKINITLNTAEDYRNFLKNYTTPIKDLNLNETNKKSLEGFGIIDPRKLLAWIEHNCQ